MCCFFLATGVGSLIGIYTQVRIIPETILFFSHRGSSCEEMTRVNGQVASH